MNVNGVEYNYNMIPSCGFLIGELTPPQLVPIWDEVLKIQKDFSIGVPHNNQLAGHLKKEFELTQCKEHLNALIEPLIWEYEKLHNYSFFKNHYNIVSKGLPCELCDTWVNFQQKHEFNPIHNHSGVMSFALWLQVPYSIQEEFAVFPDAIVKSTGCFNFHTIGSLGNIIQTTLPVDKTWVGKFAVFPSNMMHSVNPFYTSDEYRISVSGNFKLKP